jgi:hypothetical protein
LSYENRQTEGLLLLSSSIATIESGIYHGHYNCKCMKPVVTKEKVFDEIKEGLRFSQSSGWRSTCV